MNALSILDFGRVFTGISFIILSNFILPEISFCEINFLCILIFGNFAVYWQIYENFSLWKLFYFSIHENKSIQSFCGVLYLARFWF